MVIKYSCKNILPLTVYKEGYFDHHQYFSASLNNYLCKYSPMTFTVLEGLIFFKNMQWDSPVLNDADKTGVITLSENNPQLLP